MTITITKAYIKTFESNLRHLAQQSQSRLRQFVHEKTKGTSSDAFPRMGAQSMGPKSSARAATPENDSVWSNRVATPATYHGGDTVEPEDAPQMLVDPNSNITHALAMAARRQVDDIIIAAANGNAADEAGNANAFPAGQTVGGATQAFDFAFITSVAEKFLTNDIDPDEGKVFVVSPNCVKKMLSMTEATSFDYTNAKALAANGFISNWMGFTWVVSTRLPLAVDATKQRYCFAFTRRALGLLVVKDIWARVAEDPTKSFMMRIYTAMTMGAVRVEDEHIVRAHILES